MAATATNTHTRAAAAKPYARRPANANASSTAAAHGQQTATQSPASSVPVVYGPRRYSDKELPHRLDLYVRESRLYSQLLNFEQRLDACIARRMIDIQESIRTPIKTPQIMRVYMYNEYHNQDGDAALDDVPSWTLKIIAQVLDPVTQRASANPVHAFTNFISKITVQLDPKLYPGPDGTIEWRKSTSVALTDGFEIKRQGDRDVDCRISLYIDHVPARYKMSAQLREILLPSLPTTGMGAGVDGVAPPSSHSCKETDTKRNILHALWEYVKLHKLQSVSDPTSLVLNAPLAELFGADVVTMSSLLERLRLHLTAPDPFEFKYKILVAGDPQVSAQYYDLKVEAPAVFAAPSASTPPSRMIPQSPKEIQTINDKIYELMGQIHKFDRRREFLKAFSESPSEILQALIASQAQQLKHIVVRGRDQEMERRADYYRGEWVYDAVDRYMHPPEPPISLSAGIPSLAQHNAAMTAIATSASGPAAAHHLATVAAPTHGHAHARPSSSSSHNNMAAAPHR